MSGLLYEADEMAKAGLGYEDILANLRERGLTRGQARSAVFGKLIARRMEDRDNNHQVPWRLRSTTRKLENAS